MPHPCVFHRGPQCLHGILGCATGHKSSGGDNSGIALASGEFTAASLPQTMLGLFVSKSGSIAKQTRLRACDALGLFHLDAFGRRIKLSYPLSVSGGRLCSPERNLGISAVLCRLKPAVACKGGIIIQRLVHSL